MHNIYRKLAFILFSFLLISCVSTPPQPLWIDVRSAEEYQGEHLSGAINIEYTEILEGITEAGLDKNTEILLYCGSGRRAGIALEALEAAGFSNVVNRGGIAEVLEQEEN